MLCFFLQQKWFHSTLSLNCIFYYLTVIHFVCVCVCLLQHRGNHMSAALLTYQLCHMLLYVKTESCWEAFCWIKHKRWTDKSAVPATVASALSSTWQKQLVDFAAVIIARYAARYFSSSSALRFFSCFLFPFYLSLPLSVFLQSLILLIYCQPSVVAAKHLTQIGWQTMK